MDEDTQKALDELYALEKGKLEQQANVQKLKGKFNLTISINKISSVIIWLIGIIVFSFLVTWAFHLICPENWKYLSPEAQIRLDHMVSGGFAAFILSEYKRIMHK